LRIVQSADRYHVLGVSRDATALFEGNPSLIWRVPTWMICSTTWASSCSRRAGRWWWFPLR
jgi:hypothetical protein